MNKELWELWHDKNKLEQIEYKQEFIEKAFENFNNNSLLRVFDRSTFLGFGTLLFDNNLNLVAVVNGETIAGLDNISIAFGLCIDPTTLKNAMYVITFTDETIPL